MHDEKKGEKTQKKTVFDQAKQINLSKNGSFNNGLNLGPPDNNSEEFISQLNLSNLIHRFDPKKPPNAFFSQYNDTGIKNYSLEPCNTTGSYEENLKIFDNNIEKLSEHSPQNVSKRFVDAACILFLPHYSYLHKKLGEAHQKMIKLIGVNVIPDENNANNQDNSGQLKILHESINEMSLNIDNYLMIVDERIKIFERHSVNKENPLFNSGKIVSFQNDRVKLLSSQTSLEKEGLNNTLYWKEYEKNGNIGDPLLHQELNTDHALIFASGLKIIKWDHLIIKIGQIRSYEKPDYLNDHGSQDDKLFEIKFLMIQLLKRIEDNKKKEFIYFSDKNNLDPTSNTDKNNNLKLSFVNDPYKEIYNNLNDLVEEAFKCIQLIGLISTDQISEHDNEEKKLSGNKNIELLRELDEIYESFVNSYKSIEIADIHNINNLPPLENGNKKDKEWKNQSVKALKKEYQLNIGMQDRLNEMLNTFQDKAILQPNKVMEELNLTHLNNKYKSAEKEIIAQHRVYKEENCSWFRGKYNELTEWIHSHTGCCGSEESAVMLQNHSLSLDQMEEAIHPYQQGSHYVLNQLTKDKKKY